MKTMTVHLSDLAVTSGLMAQWDDQEPCPILVGHLMLEIIVSAGLADQIRFQPIAIANRWGWSATTVQDAIEQAKGRLRKAMQPKIVTVRERWVAACVERRGRAPSSYWSALNAIVRDYPSVRDQIDDILERMLAQELPPQPIAYLKGAAKRAAESHQPPPQAAPFQHEGECRGQEAAAGCRSCRQAANARAIERGALFVPWPE